MFSHAEGEVWSPIVGRAFGSNVLALTLNCASYYEAIFVSHQCANNRGRGCFLTTLLLRSVMYCYKWVSYGDIEVTSTSAARFPYILQKKA